MRNIEIEIQGEQVGGVIAIPESGAGPGVIVIQEWWGLVPHIQGVVNRLAEAGFVALAVDHYRGALTTANTSRVFMMTSVMVSRRPEPAVRFANCSLVSAGGTTAPLAYGAPLAN